MRSPRIALSLALAGAAVGLGAPAALAASPVGPSLTVTPSAVVPGQSIMITATCPTTKPGWNPSASSQAFSSTSVTLTAVASNPGMYVGYAQLPASGQYSGGPADVAPNSQWGVSATCADGTQLTASFTIKAGPVPTPKPLPTGGAATGDGASIAAVPGGAVPGVLAGTVAAGLGFLAWRRRGARQN